MMAGSAGVVNRTPLTGSGRCVRTLERVGAALTATGRHVLAVRTCSQNKPHLYSSQKFREYSSKKVQSALT